MARWLSEGRDVRIFTARASRHSKDVDMTGYIDFEINLRAWCRKYFGRALPVTAEKDFYMDELWDDRCVAVEQNTGRPLNASRRGLE